MHDSDAHAFRVDMLSWIAEVGCRLGTHLSAGGASPAVIGGGGRWSSDTLKGNARSHRNETHWVSRAMADASSHQSKKQSEQQPSDRGYVGTACKEDDVKFTES